jgi:hypothetical protein
MNPEKGLADFGVVDRVARVLRMGPISSSTTSATDKLGDGPPGLRGAPVVSL